MHPAVVAVCCSSAEKRRESCDYGEVTSVLVCSQLPWQGQTADGEAGVQPALPARFEEEAEGMSSLSARLPRPAGQKTQGICPHLQFPV